MLQHITLGLMQQLGNNKCQPQQAKEHSCLDSIEFIVKALGMQGCLRSVLSNVVRVVAPSCVVYCCPWTSGADLGDAPQ